jgi:hypothetical protein
MPSSTGSLIIDSKLKAIENIRMVSILLFYNLISNSKLNAANVAPTSQFRMCAMLLLTVAGNEKNKMFV